MALRTKDEQSIGSRQADSDDSLDPRPRFGIGHVGLAVGNPTRSAEFYTAAGMRMIVNMDRASIVELRGGTHIILRESPQAGHDSLDLIVDDIDETHALMAELGGNPTTIRRGHPHDSFTATDPDGNQLSIHSNHAMGSV